MYSRGDGVWGKQVIRHLLDCLGGRAGCIVRWWGHAATAWG